MTDCNCTDPVAQRLAAAVHADIHHAPGCEHAPAAPESAAPSYALNSSALTDAAAAAVGATTINGKAL